MQFRHQYFTLCYYHDILGCFHQHLKEHLFLDSTSTIMIVIETFLMIIVIQSSINDLFLDVKVSCPRMFYAHSVPDGADGQTRNSFHLRGNERIIQCRVVTILHLFSLCNRSTSFRTNRTRNMDFPYRTHCVHYRRASPA